MVHLVLTGKRFWARGYCSRIGPREIAGGAGQR